MLSLSKICANFAGIFSAGGGKFVNFRVNAALFSSWRDLENQGHLPWKNRISADRYNFSFQRHRDIISNSHPHVFDQTRPDCDNKGKDGIFNRAPFYVGTMRHHLNSQRPGTVRMYLGSHSVPCHLHTLIETE